MTVQSNSARIAITDFSSPGTQGKLVALTVLGVTFAAGILALAGRIESVYGMVVPVMACVAGLAATFVPRLVLTVLFTTSPLLWALGDGNIFGDSSAHVNLPMLAGFVVAIGFCHLLLIKDPDPGIDTVRKLVLALALACLPSAFWAADLFTGAGVYLRVMCPYLVMFATLQDIHTRSDAIYYAKCMLAALFSVIAVLIIGYWRSALWEDFGGGDLRLSALHFHAQGFGVYLAVMAFIVMLTFLLTRNKAYLLALPLPLVALFFTYIRTALVGAAVLVVLLAFHIKKSYGKRLLVGGLVLGAIFFSGISRSILRYDTTVDSPEVADRVLSGRLGVDAIAIETYLEAPLLNKVFGIGFFRAEEATGLVLGTEFMIHDDYLALWIEAGVFASVIYVAILIILLRRSRQGMRSARTRTPYDVCGASFALIIAVMIMGIPGAFYTQVLSNFYIYGTMGMMLALSRTRFHNHGDMPFNSSSEPLQTL